MQPLSGLLCFFFQLLYHPFAWAYDLVSWMVSLGRWKYWGESVVPFVKGTRILELGHGPGHLQRILCDLDLLAVGVDESRQMGFLANRLLIRNGYTQINLIRGLGQNLPLRAGAFDTVVATFPTEYIFEEQTLSEIRRMLTNGGRLIVLPVAWITGKGSFDRLISWLFRFTGQAPSDPFDEVSLRIKEPFLKAGFDVIVQQVEVKSSLLLILIAEKN